jgi:hypothetical protein
VRELIPKQVTTPNLVIKFEASGSAFPWVLTEQESVNKRTNLESYIAMTRDQLGKAMNRDDMSALEYVLAEAIEELEEIYDSEIR